MRVGTMVRLKKRVRAGFQTAVIQSRDDEFSKGAVYLDRPLDGLRWWNTQDLARHIPFKKARRKKR